MSDTEAAWVWWRRDEPEDNLTGFATAEDRDAFQAGEEGPFKRMVCLPGRRAIPQNEDWDGWMDRMCKEAGVPRS